jgi:hypothetical protein
VRVETFLTTSSQETSLLGLGRIICNCKFRVLKLKLAGNEMQPNY